jgi:hypothetical protein
MHEILEYAQESKLIKKSNTGLKLTLNGWERYNEVEIGDSDSKIVFMAMQFEDKQEKFIRE